MQKQDIEPTKLATGQSSRTEGAPMRLQRLWRQISLCWKDPDASPEIAAHYRIRQFHALAQQFPLGFFNILFFSILIALLYGQAHQRTLLLTWAGAQIALAGWNMIQGYRLRRCADLQTCLRAARIMTANIFVGALLFGTIPTYLFDSVDLPGKIVLAAIGTGFILHGAVQCARWPLAGVLWSLGMCLSFGASLIWFYGDLYRHLLWLTGIYCIIVCISVLLSSSQFVKSLMAETQIEKQRQLIRALLSEIEGELNTARRIQMGLLPDLDALLAEEKRISVSAALEPAQEVGGDYYECFRLDAHRYCFAIADVSGKGVPASLFMAMTKTLAANLARRGADLGEALGELSRELNRSNPEMLFVTLFIATLDARTGELHSASAGHQPPLLLRDGRVSSLDLEPALGPPLCALDDYCFQSVRHQLQPGDTLFLFTDGATEACHGDSFHGHERLAEVVAQQPVDTSMPSYVSALRDSVRDFEQGAAPSDDLTLLALRWEGSAPAPAKAS